MIYIGETRRLYRRFNEHISGRGGSNTLKYKPNKIVGLYKVNENSSFIQYRNAIESSEYNNTIINNWENNDGDNLLIENRITERIFYERRNNHEYGSGKEWYRVRGGKYTKENLEHSMLFAEKMYERPNRVIGSLKMTTPIDSIPVNSIVDRPLCNCNYPSEVKISKDKSKIYFVCALKNVWGRIFFRIWSVILNVNFGNSIRRIIL